MEDYYDRQKYDFKFVQGDTITIKFNIYDEDKNSIDITGGFSDYWGATFTLRDPISYEPLTDLQLTRNDSVSGSGIYFSSDVQLPGNITIDGNYQLAVQYTAAQSSELEPGVYPFDLQFVIPGFDDTETTYTPIRGNLVIVREETE